MIKSIRLLSQQLVQPRFGDPRELVSWMGAVQAQDCRMTRWAVGLRLREGRLSRVDRALREGEILRTHVLRPTWHLVAAEDIRWMLALSGPRIIAANESYGRSAGIPAENYTKGLKLLESILRDGRSLTREEITREMCGRGVKDDNFLIRRILTHAEAIALICSGPDKGSKFTYALLEERVPPVAEPTHEEALARLAIKYFRSHSPASLEDFTWWSGLTVREAREAVESIGGELVREKLSEREVLIYRGCVSAQADDHVHLLPAYDEYLISYKDRTAALAAEHVAKAHNNYGIFYPVILHGGRVVGNWKPGKGKAAPAISFFDGLPVPPGESVDQAVARYRSFKEE